MPEGTLQLEHLMQATKLLQLKKASLADIEIIYECGASSFSAKLRADFSSLAVSAGCSPPLRSRVSPFIARFLRPMLTLVPSELIANCSPLSSSFVTAHTDPFTFTDYVADYENAISTEYVCSSSWPISVADLALRFSGSFAPSTRGSSQATRTTTCCCPQKSRRLGRTRSHCRARSLVSRVRLRSFYLCAPILTYPYHSLHPRFDAALHLYNGAKLTPYRFPAAWLNAPSLRLLVQFGGCSPLLTLDNPFNGPPPLQFQREIPLSYGQRRALLPLRTLRTPPADGSRSGPFFLPTTRDAKSVPLFCNLWSICIERKSTNPVA